MNNNIEKKFREIIENDTTFISIYGKNREIIQRKEELTLKIWEKFKSVSQSYHNLENISFVIVPNRVEILGKHTDYQGGRTLLLTGPKSFIAISTKSHDNNYEFFNLTKKYGNIKITQKGNSLFNTEKMGLGWQYSLTVIKRLTSNFSSFKIDPIKSVFFGDIPIGGGTSGSSAKVIMDFLNITISNRLINDPAFKNTILENGKAANILYNQPGIDNFKLALSMYIANYENGLDYGNLKGNKGVGTFGGSEDHTAIILGEKDKILFCRYCPTQLIKKINWPKEYTIVVAFSGRKAEKTIDAREKYNRLSLMASKSVEELNRINSTNFIMLRDFFKDLPSEKRADTAYNQLVTSGYEELAERSYQFFKEEEIIEKATDCLVNNKFNDFGEYIKESHKLSKKYLKNIVPEIDFLQKEAIKLGAIGASGFGAGFGGSCYAIIKKGSENDFIELWKNRYLKKYPQYNQIAEFDEYPPCGGSYWEEING